MIESKIVYFCHFVAISMFTTHVEIVKIVLPENRKKEKLCFRFFLGLN